MPTPKYRISPVSQVLAANKSTRTTISTLRALDQSASALKYSLEGARHELKHGRRAKKDRICVGASRFGHCLRREAGFVGLAVLKPLLILVFNTLAVSVFIWLLSLVSLL